jgi:hypothetical protein
MKDNNRAIREINKTDLFEDIHDILKKELKIARLAFEDDFSSDGYIFEDLGTPLS